MNIFKKLNFYTALLAAKTTNLGLHILKRSGTSLPGVVALKLQKDFLSNLSSYCTKNIVTVTGTNGKTTTAGLLSHILKTARFNVLNNEKGANMLSGIASALAVGYKPFSSFDYAVLESDEAYLTKLYDFVKSDYLIVTNLFRDQLDRYGELDTTAKKIQDAIEKNSALTVFINADDPMLKGLGKNNKKIYFGFEDIVYENKTKESQSPMESVVCKCKTVLTYIKRFYAHLGQYFCSNCRNDHPVLDYSACAKIGADSTVLYIKKGANQFEFKISLAGLYNAYNALAAISAAIEMNIDPGSVQDALDSYKSVFGRSQRLVVNGKKVLVQLIKNPTGASEVLRTVDRNQNEKILIAINDDYADGRDVSWLWDADFELLNEFDGEIITSGERCLDMALRLKYAGFDTNKISIEKDLKTALTKALNTVQNGKQLLILPTYTALLKMQRIFKSSLF